jgi:hypothetical protein
MRQDIILYVEFYSATKKIISKAEWKCYSELSVIKSSAIMFLVGLRNGNLEYISFTFIRKVKEKLIPKRDLTVTTLWKLDVLPDRRKNSLSL